MRVFGLLSKNHTTEISEEQYASIIKSSWNSVVKILGDSYRLEIWSDEFVIPENIYETEKAFCAIFGTVLDRFGNQIPHPARLFLAEKLNFPNLTQGAVVGIFLDKITGELSIYRDRFGSRTIYWKNSPRQILFSSEIKFILNENPNLNQETLFNFMSLNYRMVYGRSDTFFEGISEIPTACMCSFNSYFEPSINRYWQPPNSVSHLSSEDLQIEFELRFNKSMKRSLKEAKNPIFYLSGGLDAPLVAAVGKSMMGSKINTIGAVFPGFDDNNEEVFINDLVADLSLNHIEIDGSKLDYFKLLDENVKRQDQPILSATDLLFSHMLSVVSDLKYLEIFGGGGGDLVTQGCLEYQPYVLADLLNESPGLFQVEIGNWTNQVGPYLRYWPKSESQMRDLIKVITETSNSRLQAKHNPDWLATNASIFSNEIAERFKSSRNPIMEWDYSTFRQIRLADEFYRQAVPTHFVEEININTYKGIKSFDPFWDLELIELGFRLPLHGIFKNGWTKPLTREFGKNILPDSILNRRDKTGLGVPLEVLVNNEKLKNLALSLLSDHTALDKLGFDKTKAKIIQKQINKKDSYMNESYFWKISAIAGWFYAWI